MHKKKKKGKRAKTKMWFSFFFVLGCIQKSQGGRETKGPSTGVTMRHAERDRTYLEMRGIQRRKGLQNVEGRGESR